MIEQQPFEAFNFEHLWRTPATTEPQPPTPESIKSKPQVPTPETQTETETSEASFDTVPELSEPVEWLFATLSKKVTTNTPTTINNNKTKPKTPISSTMASLLNPEPMNVDSTGQTHGIRTGRIIPFSGKWNALGKFLDSLQLHFILNKIKDDKDKVVFALTYMEGGDADSWKEAFLKTACKNDGSIDFGTWKDFMKNIKEDFKPYDTKGDALDEIIRLWQGTNSIEDHVSQFKVLLKDSGVEVTSPAALDYFQRSIQVPLLRKIMDLADLPTTLNKWYDWALKFDANYHQLMRLINRGKPKKEEKTKLRWTFRRTEKDPNAMDIDVITHTYNTLTPEERTEFMKKGLCFQCKKPGHLSRDCPDKKGKTPTTTASTSTTSASTPSAAPKKMTAKELTAHIWSLTALLDETERNEFYNEAEKEGF